MRRLAELLGRQDIQSLPTKISPKTRPIGFSWQHGPVYPKAVIELECRLQDIETEVTKRSPPKDEDNWCKELLEEEHEPAQAECIEDKTQPTIAAGEGWSPVRIGAASSMVDAFLGGGKPVENIRVSISRIVRERGSRSHSRTRATRSMRSISTTKNEITNISGTSVDTPTTGSTGGRGHPAYA
jgi:hypothetical protein